MVIMYMILHPNKSGEAFCIKWADTLYKGLKFKALKITELFVIEPCCVKILFSGSIISLKSMQCHLDSAWPVVLSGKHRDVVKF